VRSSFGHTSCATTSAKATFFATKGDETFVFTVGALEAQESVCEYAALEKGLEFFGHVLWKMFAFSRAQVLEASQVFLHDFVEECGFRTSTNVSGVIPREGCLLATSMAVRM
jgi:hypothetical protein